MSIEEKRSSTQPLLDDDCEDEEPAHGPSASKKLKIDELSWGSDPLFWTHLCLLNVHVVKGLVPSGSTWDEVNRERQRLGFNHALPKTNRVVSCCHVMGVLVRFHRNSMFTTFTIDDGTALLDCVEWTSPEYVPALSAAEHKYPLGCIIRCFGKLEWPSLKFQNPFRSAVRRVLLSRSPSVVSSTEEELFHWDQACRLWSTVYSEPFDLQPKPTMSRPEVSKVEFIYGSAIEDAIMGVLKQTGKMPLVSVDNEQQIKSQYAVFYKICFEPKCAAREDPLASLLAVESGGNREQASNLVKAAVKQLCFKGHVLAMDAKLDLYAILTHEDFLAPAILRAIAKSKKEFVDIQLVIDKLREDPRLYRVSKDRFTASLKRLVNDSFVYEGEAGTIALIKNE